jgi:DNA processing protein
MNASTFHSASDPLPPGAYVAALAGFRHMTVHRLAALLRHHEPAEAWQVALGERPASGLIAKVLANRDVRSAWRADTQRRTPAAAWQRCADLDITVLWPSHVGYPGLLLDDPLPPPVLFARGNLGLLGGRRVAIVGTRNATQAGRRFARVLAGDLALAGVHVVSGLARGVDGSAHAGVVAADGCGRPIAVVGSGPDVVYPREHADLWAAVVNCGLLLSEAPPGSPPDAWRFPLRNRVVAALAEVVVVVESRETGGSLITAAEALDRGVPLMAVPGGPSNRAAAGVNQLLRDGAAPVLDAGDVLAVLQLEHARQFAAPIDLRPRPRLQDREVYRALSTEPRTIDGVALATGISLVEAAMRLARLEAAGWVAQADGWFECVGSPL